MKTLFFLSFRQKLIYVYKSMPMQDSKNFILIKVLNPDSGRNVKE